MKCDIAQGFHFSEALPAEAFARLIRERAEAAVSLA
jgi:EAL domain-containing protein (putative c-di-GMP-specific phosphodiesterase class I)